MGTEPGQDITPAPGAAPTAWEEPRDFIEAGIQLARLRAECSRLRQKLAEYETAGEKEPG